MQRQVVIVGGGIVGLATAYKLLLGKRHNDVVVLEKERDVGLHQSTHNSGVLHAGLHYAPGSLKARLAREGIREMVAFCREHGIAHEQCGKLMVATDTAERDRLRVLLERGTANGLRGLRWVEGGELRELEPHVGGAWGVHVPEEGIVDYAAVCAALRREVERLGGEIVVHAAVRRVYRETGADGPWVVESDARTERAGVLVNCAGLHADRVARMAGERPEVRVIPFRGEYWMLRAERTALVRNLIYPVPDPAFPFLGVHFTRMVHGGIEAGPNAVLALAREGYSWRHVNARDLASAMSFPGLWRFLARYPRTAAYEVARSFSRRLFVRSLQKLVPQVRGDDLVRGGSGVRAQVMTPKGELVQDFLIARSPGAVHVISAPSPAATASLAIGSAIAGMLT
jgi:L-2-hydroxyglutarate oxidase